MVVERQTLFLDRLRESQLLESARLEELARLPEATDPDPHALARVVLKRGWLSKFQLNQVGQGKARELKVGHYVVLDRLGEGGMGQVFKAQHQHMQRTVALKVIRKERLSHPDAVKRFYQEAQAAAALVHPNIVLAYDAGPTGNTHYFAMEYVEGVDLSQLVKGSGPLPVALACEYVRQAALGLQHAFEKGLVHRDIKPANLLLGAAGKDGAKGIVKILDMGLARFSGGDREKGLTQTGQVIGTPDYLAPEQAMDSRQADIRSDIYSLGCSLYYLLAGKAPFQGETLTQVLLQHQMEEAPPIRRSDVPAGLQAVLAQMMAKSPDDRYQAPAEVAEALALFCGGGAPVAGEESAFAAIVETSGKVKAWEDTMGGDEPPAARKAARKAAVSATTSYAGDRKKKGAAKEPESKRTLLWIVAGGGGAVLLLLIGLVVWLVSRSGPAPVVLGPGPGPKVPVLNPKDKDARPKDLDKIKDKDAKTKDKDGKPKDKNNPIVPPDPPLGNPLDQGLPPATGLSPLDKLDPARIPPDKRHPGFPELVAVLQGHGGEVWSVCFSGDGKRLLTGSQDKQALLWDLTGNEPRTLLFLGSGDTGIGETALSPNGRTVALNGQRGDVRLWDIDGVNTRQRPTLSGHRSATATLVISPDGNTLAFGAEQGEIHLFDLRAEIPQVRARLTGHKLPLAGLSFSRNGTTLASAADDGTARLWDMTQKQPSLKKVVEGLPPRPLAVALSPDAQKLAASFSDGTVHLWDVSAEPRKVAGAKGHIDWASACFFAPDGKSYFSSGGGMSSRGPRVAVWWDSKDGSRRKEWVLPERCAGAAISPDGHYLALACHNRNVYILRLPADGGPKPPPVAAGAIAELRQFVSQDPDLKKPVVAVAFSPVQQRAVSAHYGFALVWDLTTGQQVLRIDGEQHEVFHAAAFSADGSRLLLGSARNRARLFDAATGQEVKSFECPTGVRCVALSPDGRYAATGSGSAVKKGGQVVFEDCLVRLWNVASGKEEFCSKPFKGRIEALRFSADGSRLLYADVQSYGILEVEGKREGIAEWKLPVNAIGFYPDGREALVAEGDGSLRVFDLQTRVAGRRLSGHTGIVQAIVVAPDGKRAISSGGMVELKDGQQVKTDCTVRLWDLVTGSELGRFNGHEHYVNCLALSADGTRALSGSFDRTMRLLDLTKPPVPPGKGQ